jgi:rSAM/selenodomain-associated transferase 1
VGEVAANAVVVFAKAPVPGRVKTRLAEAIGANAAADLHRAFLADLAETVASTGATGYLALAGDEHHTGFDPYREHGFDFVTQGQGDLGDRLARVTSDLFARGHNKVVVVGSDSPTLQARHFAEAFAALERVPVVLGPSFDGGYYLIGLDSPYPEVFADIAWSTTAVASQTLSRCRQHGLLWDLLGFWYDVDTIDDLDFLRFHLLGHLTQMNANTLPHTVRALQQLEPAGLSPEH